MARTMPENRRPMLRLLPLLVACLLLAAFAATARAQSLHIQSALSAVGDGNSFPTDNSVRSIALPDEWARSRPSTSGPVWYRVGFPAPSISQRGDLAGLYIEHVCSNLEVYLNGQQVASAGRME